MIAAASSTALLCGECPRQKNANRVAACFVFRDEVECLAIGSFRGDRIFFFGSHSLFQQVFDRRRENPLNPFAKLVFGEETHELIDNRAITQSSNEGNRLHAEGRQLRATRRRRLSRARICPGNSACILSSRGAELPAVGRTRGRLVKSTTIGTSEERATTFARRWRS